MSLAEQYTIQNKYQDNFLIISEEQTHGRGRKGNNWVSPKGGLWFNLGLNHISKQKSFTLFIGYCILKTLNELVGEEIFKIKWPNDIYLFNKKVCGLICSQYPQYNKTLIGVGINTNIPYMPDEAPANSDSIKNLLNVNIDNLNFLGILINELFYNLDSFEDKGFDFFAKYYNSNDFLKDKEISILSGNNQHNGKYCGVNNDGALLIKSFSGEDLVIYSGIVNVL